MYLHRVGWLVFRYLVAIILLSAVRKCTRAKKLTIQMLGELIERIEVHQSEKVDGVSIQKLTIHYRCVGTLEIQVLDKIPQPEVTMKTRKGVAVSYSNPKNSVNLLCRCKCCKRRQWIH